LIGCIVSLAIYRLLASIPGMILNRVHSFSMLNTTEDRERQRQFVEQTRILYYLTTRAFIPIVAGWVVSLAQARWLRVPAPMMAIPAIFVTLFFATLEGPLALLLPVPLFFLSPYLVAQFLGRRPPPLPPTGGV
jgi:hypothetical protein